MKILLGQVQRASPSWLGFDTDTKVSSELAT
jgi:hypothetical protein